MLPLRPPDQTDDRAGFVPLLLANLLPLVGVVWLGWEPVALVLIYGVELVVSILLAGVKALFAQRPPPTERDGVVTASESLLAEKRGRVQIHGALPPIYPRNVPFALGVVAGLVMYSVFFGVVVFAIFQPDGSVIEPSVLASVLTLVVGQLAETSRQYFRKREYERVSPYAVVEAPVRQLFVLLFLLAFLGLFLGALGSLVLVVCVKLFVEWSSYRAARAETDASRFVDRFVGWFAGPSESTETPGPVRVPETDSELDPVDRISVDRTAVLLEGVVHSIWGMAFFLPFFGVVWLLAVIAVVAWSGSVLLFWLGVAASAVLLALTLAIQVATHYLEHGTLEYRRRGDHIVAYDRLLEEPQWAESVYRLRNVRLEHGRFVDRLLDTWTVRVTTGIRSPSVLSSCLSPPVCRWTLASTRSCTRRFSCSSRWDSGSGPVPTGRSDGRNPVRNGSCAVATTDWSSLESATILPDRSHRLLSGSMTCVPFQESTTSTGSPLRTVFPRSDSGTRAMSIVA
ncbi:DUF6498-containing protein [Natronolimnohabitans sp. A-GB9]|uniref:DUF6498-containing protein n=1 Tax=Natronolimnohabitans sp. A-GB9 TaxID=3069757 RepID=UPI0027B66E97|nr:DUF6498-containing protein [Natronolimnohabitans sp. A-GB9]MDQ2050186.1 DUF6498-containing protein [Natronolimnohabitans sp. A-GB9]